MGIIERQWATLKKVFGNIGNLEITRRALTLGSRDATTRWRAKSWEESIITTFIIPKSAQSRALAAGYHVSLDALGIMDPSNDIVEGDEVKNSGDVYYEVKAIKNPEIGDKPALYECDLHKLPLHIPGFTAFANTGISQPINFACYPSALYYNGVTYIIFQGAALDPYAISYTHSSDAWATAVKVADNPLGNDDHGAPAICIDNNHYLHAFYGCHGSAMKHAKANASESIAAWTVQANPVAASATYPKVVSSGANIYLFYRISVSSTHKKFCLKVSADNGANWGAQSDIIDFGDGSWIYLGHTELKSGKIHMAWCYVDTSDSMRYNIYHAYYKIADGKMYSAGGTDLGTTIDKTEADAHCLVVDTGTDCTTLPALHVDGIGQPWIIYIKGVYDTSNWTIYHTRWSDTSSTWTTPEEITKTDNQANYTDFIITSSTNVDAYVTAKGETGRGGDLERFNWNGTVWTKKAIIYAETFSRDALGNPMVPVNFDSEIKLVFCQVDPDDYTTIDLEVYSYPT